MSGPPLWVNEKTIHMALLSAKQAEAVTNGWGKATIPMSAGHTGPFHCASHRSRVISNTRSEMKGNVCMKFVRLLQGKLIVVALVSVAVVGGATAFAATSAGQGLVHAITDRAHATASPDVESHSNNHQANNSNKNTCPGLPDAQRLATQFALSTASTGDDIQALCALHQGNFTGTTPNGTSVSSERVFGYGEIDQLLTYAQFLAGQDKANAGGKLTSANARSFLAEAVQSCGTTPLMTCLKTNIPGFEPGNSNDASHGNENGHGKPSSTPTPHH